MISKHKYIDISGKQFGRLKAIRYIGVKWDSALWHCQCYCGNFTECTIGDLNRHKSPRRTCGHCYDHKKYPTEYYRWRNMYNRCYDKSNPDYKNYGARGIKVCLRWHNFLHFLEDVGLIEDPNLTLDRIDNEGDYTKENIRFATRWEQNNNKRNTLGSQFNIIDSYVEELRDKGG